MTKLESPPGYRILDGSAVKEVLAASSTCAELLGGEASTWQTNEVGDGNLNQVYIVEGPAGSLVVKQALPYLRLVGESWPLPLSRAHFENLALASQYRITPRSVPKVIEYDSKLYCIVMEHLSPHIIMRKGMIAGTRYDGFAEVLTTFMARNLFYTSDLHLPTGDKRLQVGEFCANHVLCKITEDVIFTEPYMEHPNNRWTSPQLDGYAERWRGDSALHGAISRLKVKYLTASQALLHGDLHTGSIMVTEDDTRVIDPEFAFYGPMGFDVGKLIGNFIISYFSQSGYENSPGERDDYRSWILDTTVLLWDDFARKFLALWRDRDAANGDAFPTRLFGDEAALETQRQVYMDELFADAVAFCGACLTRRILGIAHNIDFEQIEDPALRAICEARALELSRRLLVEQGDFKSIGDIIAATQSLQQTQPQLA